MEDQEAKNKRIDLWWSNLPAEERALITRCVPDGQPLSLLYADKLGWLQEKCPTSYDKLKAFDAKAQAAVAHYRDLAGNYRHEGLEFDELPLVSLEQSEKLGEGAWVQCWLWVDSGLFARVEILPMAQGVEAPRTDQGWALWSFNQSHGQHYRAPADVPREAILTACVKEGKMYPLSYHPQAEDRRWWFRDEAPAEAIRNAGLLVWNGVAEATDRDEAAKFLEATNAWWHGGVYGFEIAQSATEPGVIEYGFYGLRNLIRAVNSVVSAEVQIRFTCEADPKVAARAQELYSLLKEGGQLQDHG